MNTIKLVPGFLYNFSMFYFMYCSSDLMYPLKNALAELAKLMKLLIISGEQLKVAFVKPTLEDSIRKPWQ